MGPLLTPSGQQGPELDERSHAEPDGGQQAVEVERTVGAMLTVIKKGALVEVPDGPGFVAAAHPGVVEDFHLRQVVDEPTRLPGPAAQVCILEVHEEALIHRPDLF